jgi:TRAP-type C4-dicarboxylate transport system permease small subunit
MKLSAITYLVLTTFVLITVAIFAAMDFPFGWVFYLTVLGQALLIFSVFKVLRDSYTTDKTFKDFYEDHPIGQEE